MTRDELLSFAQQAGIEVHYRKQQARIGIDELTGQDSTGKLERFAALVASAEREACAKACDTQQRINLDWGDEQRADTARTCAAAIRARPAAHKES